MTKNNESFDEWAKEEAEIYKSLARRAWQASGEYHRKKAIEECLEIMKNYNLKNNYVITVDLVEEIKKLLDGGE